MSEEEVTIGEARDYPPMKINETVEDKSHFLVIIPIAAIVIVMALIVFTYYDQQTVIYPEDIVGLQVVDQPPYARDSTGIDNVGTKISHTIPTTQEIIRTLVWANTEVTTERLVELETELMNAAILNDNKVSLGERYFLDIITFTAYPEYCLNDPENAQCEFFTILYNQGLYQDGIIDRDQYWLNIRQYASEETIAEVESNDQS